MFMQAHFAFLITCCLFKRPNAGLYFTHTPLCIEVNIDTSFRYFKPMYLFRPSQPLQLNKQHKTGIFIFK